MRESKMFYSQLVKFCFAKGIRPTPMMKKIGVSATNLKRWQNGSTVNSDILIKIAEYLQVDIDSLFTDVDYKTATENYDNKAGRKAITNTKETASNIIEPDFTRYEYYVNGYRKADNTFNSYNYLVDNRTKVVYAEKIYNESRAVFPLLKANGKPVLAIELGLEPLEKEENDE